jgi:recombination protein RecR
MASGLIEQLMDALQCLPGVGPKSAQRMTYYLLERDRQGALQLAEVLQAAATRIGHCQRCRTFTEADICDICARPGRDATTLCIVETPADVQAIEAATDYKGVYFVLMGHLSPLDGIGPAEIGLDQFAKRLEQQTITEIILATSTTVEGEATAHYIADMVSGRDIKVSRIAHGVPMGGELEFVNRSTLQHAFKGRRQV